VDGKDVLLSEIYGGFRKSAKVLLLFVGILLALIVAASLVTKY
jgi:hypothetical protein